jgi:ATP-dependent metalloprotease FtsH
MKSKREHHFRARLLMGNALAIGAFFLCQPAIASAAPSTEPSGTSAETSGSTKTASWLDGLVSNPTSAATITDIDLKQGSTVVDVHLKQDSVSYHVKLYDAVSVETMQHHAESNGVRVVVDPDPNEHSLVQSFENLPLYQKVCIGLFAAIFILLGVPFGVKKLIHRSGPRRLRSGALLYLPAKSLKVTKEPVDGQKRVVHLVGVFVERLKTFYCPGTSLHVTRDMVIGQKWAMDSVDVFIDFLRNPQKYVEMGARMPAGLLFKGPPGVGKTLIAKMIATEAGVPLLYIPASKFMNKYVGVGAAKVRKLFKEARSRGPCVIFVDELDSIGGARGGGDSGGHQEQEQTLNALLTELDGIQSREGILFVGATNLDERLDSALTRPGRIDEIITFTNPSRSERVQMLELYIPERFRCDDLNVDDISRMLHGASGAIIENVANQGKIAAARAGLTKISQALLDEAVQKVTIGARRDGLMPTEHEIHVTAVHECGHLAVHRKKTGRTALRISIEPRGNVGGHVLHDQESELYITEQNFKNQLAIYMGGKVAVELYCNGQQDSGPSNDLQETTRIALEMVTQHGMSKLGLVSLSGYPNLDLIPESLKNQIYCEVNELLAEARREALEAITADEDAFMRMVVALKEKEILLRSDIDALFDSKTESEEGQTTN